MKNQEYVRTQTLGNSKNSPNIACCWIGGARYSHPLDKTSEKKFRALKPLGELFIIGFSPNILPRQFTEHAHFYLMPQLPWAILRYAEMLILGTILTLWIIFRNRVQILVAQSPYEGVAAALAKKMASCFGRKVVLVVESHGDFEESLFLQKQIRFTGIYRLLMRYAANFTLNSADLLRSVSHVTGQQLQRWLSDKSIVQFPTWTDIETFLNVSVPRNEPESPKVVYAGVLTYLKGLTHLVNAFASIAQDFTQTKLVIIGREDDKTYADQLKAQVRKLGLESQVQFISQLEQPELAKYMSQASVFVLPSLSEGLGRVVLEAMATGTPAIASKVGGIPDIVQEGINGFLVPPGDEKALAERLRWMLEHPTEAKEMGRYARAFAEQFFSTEGYVQGYGKIFEAAQELLNQGGMNHAPSTF
ncbi:glycosyltransferase family 4 protein [Phormidium sp. CCY1219]|uniref:glycosyltransferase family 4 protein n=1 Tax=Phormidium sp. CCY1219 TaxID=2886104 RepID=UPI002D1EB01F|nr:glycosyltransferase [Phormidium sp. CCY1219]MEB3830090.1 glycosyltransferase [Phormidium sp. CCY1219]